MDMNVVIAVGCCNCAIAIVVLIVTGWTIRFRRYVVALAECCDRWEHDCQLLLSNAPDSLTIGRSQINSLHQLYQQQSILLDRLRALGIFWGVARSLLIKRR
jgi:hypothetical protein